MISSSTAQRAGPVRRASPKVSAPSPTRPPVAAKRSPSPAARGTKATAVAPSVPALRSSSNPRSGGGIQVSRGAIAASGQQQQQQQQQVGSSGRRRGASPAAAASATRSNNVPPGSKAAAAAAAAAAASPTTPHSVIDSSAAPSGSDIEERQAKDVILPHDPDEKKMRKLLRGSKIFYSTFARDAVDLAARTLGIRRCISYSDADLIWMEANPLSAEGLRTLDKDQRTNIFVGMKSLAHKDEFAQATNLARSCIDSMYPSTFAFLPKTFELPAQRAEVMEIAGEAASRSGKSSATGRKPLRSRRDNKIARLVSMGKAQESDLMSATASTRSLLGDDDGNDGDTRSVDSDLHRRYEEVLGGEPVYIVKPGEGCQGDGIYLAKPADLAKIPATERCVVQSYVANPLLLPSGDSKVPSHKFDLRIYVLLTSVQPLRFHIFREGLARFATMPYFEEDGRIAPFRKANAHLTNYSLNKYSNDFVGNVNEDRDEGCSKRTISTAFRQCAEHYTGFDEEEVWRAIGELTTSTFLAISPFLLLPPDVERTCDPDCSVHMPCFQIVGIDVLLDSSLQPHLLEINSHPSMMSDAPVDALVKGLLARYALRMVCWPVAWRHRNRMNRNKKKRRWGMGKESGAAGAAAAAVAAASSPAAVASKTVEEDEEEEEDADDDDEGEKLPRVALLGRHRRGAGRNSSSSRSGSDVSSDVGSTKRHGPVVDGPGSGTNCPLPASAAAAAAAAAVETPATRKFYEELMDDVVPFDGVVPDNQADWERKVAGPLFISFEPDVTARPVYAHAVRPLLRLRDIFVQSCGGATNKNRSIDAMGSTRFNRFCRRYGILGAGKTSSEIDLLFIRHTRDKGQKDLRFTDFVYLLLREIGDALAGPGSGDKLNAVVDFLDSHDTGSIANPTSPPGAAAGVSASVPNLQQQKLNR